MIPVPTSREQLTLEWLQEALKQQDFDIVSFSWDNEGLVGGGIGALSSLERIKVQVLKRGRNAEELSLIIKTPPYSNEGLKQFVLSEGKGK